MEAAERISRRKAEHIAGAIDHDVTAEASACWDDVVLVHQAVPELDRAHVDLRTAFLGHCLQAPLAISALTGGTERAATINRRLAEAAQRHGLAIGLGSQRAMSVATSLAESYTVARRAAPTAFLIANVGAPQLVPQQHAPPLTVEAVRRLVDAVEANALAVHLNFLQECIQDGGDTNASGVLAAIEGLASAIEVPVIVKETGNGISREAARQLANVGAAAIDVGGAGGSSMALMEAVRAADRGDDVLDRLGRRFADWGIPTPAAVLEVVPLGLPVIATGGVRHGIDVARALALGATLSGMGRPMLMAADHSDDALEALIAATLEELRTVCFLTASPTVGALQRARRIIRPALAAWTIDTPTAPRFP